MDKDKQQKAQGLITVMRTIAARSTDSATAAQIQGKLNELERLIK